MANLLQRIVRSQEAWLFAIIVILVITFSIAAPQFFTVRNLYDILTSNAYVGILCAGLLVVLIAGGIDVSFTATASIAQYVAITIINRFGGDWPLVIFYAAIVGLCCGLLNAVIIYRFKVPSIIATIAMLNVYYGLLITATSGRYISDMPDWFSSGISFFGADAATTWDINLQIILLLFSFASTWFLLRMTNVGRQIYAMGGNPDAARRVGFGLFGLHLIVYGYMGFMAGIASVAQAQLSLQVMPSALVGKELDVLAAVVLGGASLSGGRGSILGTVLGVTLLAIMQTGLLMIGVSSYWLQFFSGAVIVLAVSVTALRLQRTNRLRKAFA